MKFLLLLLTILISASAFIQAADVGLNDANLLQKRLESGSASERLLAVQQCSTNIGIALDINPHTGQPWGAVDDNIVPPLIQALKDQDSKVRDRACGAFAKIAVSTQRVNYPWIQGHPDLTKFPVLKEMFLELMDDPEKHIRENAMRIYVLTWPFNQVIEQKVIKQFYIEQSEIIKDLIVEGLLISGKPSLSALQFIIERLNEPHYATLAAQAVFESLTPPPKELLVPIGSAFSRCIEEQQDNAYKKQTFAKVLGAYGSQAKMYLPKLNQIFSEESNPVIKATLKSVIQAIDSNQPSIPFNKQAHIISTK